MNTFFFFSYRCQTTLCVAYNTRPLRIELTGYVKYKIIILLLSLFLLNITDMYETLYCTRHFSDGKIDYNSDITVCHTIKKKGKENHVTFYWLWNWKEWFLFKNPKRYLSFKIIIRVWAQRRTRSGNISRYGRTSKTAHPFVRPKKKVEYYTKH